jgi:death-on-curing family protein
MDDLIYPTRRDFEIFVGIISEGEYSITKYLPYTNESWYVSVTECVQYVKDTSYYEKCSVFDVGARLLYKITKRHELGDGNKRSAVLSVYLFFLLNDYGISQPEYLKKLAKNVALSKGRQNEELLRRRLAAKLESITIKSNYTRQ